MAQIVLTFVEKQNQQFIATTENKQIIVRVFYVTILFY